MIVAHVTNSLANIVTIEAALLGTDSKTIGAVHYQSSEDRGTQMTGQNDVKAKDDCNLKLDQKCEVQLLNGYAEYHDQFPGMLSGFQSVLDGHLRQMNIAKHRIGLRGENTQPIPSAPYHAGPRAREFEKEEICKMFSQKFIKLAQTKWAVLIVFAPKKD